MRPAVKLVLVLAASGWPAAHAFTAEGHRVVGLIADAYLCAETRTWLAPLLEGSDLASAGVWADAIRGDPAWAHTNPWHYIDVDDRESLGTAMRRTPDNVLAALGRAERELSDPRVSQAGRAQALRFFVHFVADVHQPLHVGRPGDRGGNEVALRRGEARLNLHELWDGRMLLASEKLATRDLAAAIRVLAIGEEAAWRDSGPLDWAEESRSWRGLVYDLPQGRSPVRISGAYFTRARNVVSLRLAQAGVRLAGRLDRLGCPGPATAPNR